MPDTASQDRLFHLDNLRVALVILVVLHHVSIVCSAVSPFYYVEPPFTHPQDFTVLASFALFNQAWFMGAPFLVAAYFTPGAIDRHGVGAFVKSRLMRLGIPILMSIFIISPLATIGHWLMPPQLTGITTPLTWDAYPALLGIGILWFAALLLVFGLGYAAWYAVTGSPGITETTPGRLTPVGILLFTAGLAIVSFLMRYVVPLDREITLFVKALKFPSIAYLPQYLGLFLGGIVAFRRNWLAVLPSSLGLWGFLAAALAAVFLYPLALTGQMFTVAFTEAPSFVGNGHWQSAVYAAWDAIMAVGLSLGFVVLFRALFNTQGGVARFLSRHSYAVYVVHVPVVVYLAYALRDVALAPLPKAALAALIIVPACFALAFVVRKLPLMSRAL